MVDRPRELGNFMGVGHLLAADKVMKLLGQGFQKLEHEHDRHTHRQTRLNALPAALQMVTIISVFLESDDFRGY